MSKWEGGEGERQRGRIRRGRRPWRDLEGARQCEQGRKGVETPVGDTATRAGSQGGAVERAGVLGDAAAGKGSLGSRDQGGGMVTWAGLQWWRPWRGQGDEGEGVGTTHYKPTAAEGGGGEEKDKMKSCF